jgi:hypothetical protein
VRRGFRNPLRRRLLKKQKQSSELLPDNTAMEISVEEAKDNVDGIAAVEADAATLGFEFTD